MSLQNPDSDIYLNFGSNLLDRLRRKQNFLVTWVALELGLHILIPNGYPEKNTKAQQ